MKKRTIAILVIVVAALGAGTVIFIWSDPDKAEKIPVSTVAPAAPTPIQQPAADSAKEFDKTAHSITDSSSIWVIANKKHPLSKGYGPAKLAVPKIPLRLGAGEEQMQVSSTIAQPLEEMVAAAKQAGVRLKLSSGYRSEALQTQFYNNYVAKDGQAAADRYSARPGTSEHQTGLAVDMISADDKCHLEVCFADTPEGKWLASHAHEYGFIIRYLKDKESETTYQYEPWHIRYVGKELASELYKNGQTMEAFFNYL